MALKKTSFFFERPGFNGNFKINYPFLFNLAQLIGLNWVQLIFFIFYKINCVNKSVFQRPKLVLIYVYRCQKLFYFIGVRDKIS